MCRALAWWQGIPLDQLSRRPITGPERRAQVTQWAEAKGLVLMLADGFDEAIVGVIQQNDGHPAVLYHGAKLAALLAQQHPTWTAEDITAWCADHMGGTLGVGYPAYLMMHCPAFVEEARTCPNMRPTC